MVRLSVIFISILTATLSVAVDNTSESSYSGWTTRELKQCKKISRIAPPHWVMTTAYDSDKAARQPPNQNYKLGEQIESESPFLVPKRSIVQIHPKFQERFEQQKEHLSKKMDFVRVRVLSVPPENKKLLEADSGGVKRIVRHRHPRTQIATPGSEGFMRFQDLEAVQDQKGYVFAVKKDSEIYDYLESKNLGTDTFALKLYQENGKYLVNHCCGEVVSENSSTPTVTICRDFAIYEVLDAKTGESIKGLSPLEVDCESCYLKSMIAISNDFLKPLQGVLAAIKTDSAFRHINSFEKVNLVDSRGFVQIPVQPISDKHDARQGPFGSIHYNAEKGDSDLYMKPESACGFMQVLKSYQRKYCPDGKDNCQIRFGNASHAYYNSAIARGQSFWPHSSHDSGECVDIRPVYKSGCDGDCSFRSSQFQADQFKKLMQLMESAGADQCLIGHTTISREFSSCSYQSDHDDHLHICFPVKKGSELNNRLIKACEKGIP